jgi:hypothetical protein
MSKMSELDRQRQEVDEETGIRHYDTDSMRDEFDKEIEQLEANEQAELDGWNDKMRDYAMDNMTSDVAQEVVNYE